MKWDTFCEPFSIKVDEQINAKIHTEKVVKIDEQLMWKLIDFRYFPESVFTKKT